MAAGAGCKRHRIGGDAHAVAALHGAGNGDGNFAADGGLAENGAGGGALRDIVRREFGEPRFRVRKSFDQIRVAEGRDHGRLAGGDQQSVDEGALIVREADVAFAVGDAHEKGGDGDVIGIGRRKLERADRRILRVRAQHLERIDARANFRLDRFAGIRIGIGGKRDQQDAQRLRGVQRQKPGRIAQQGDAAVGDGLRLRFVFGRPNFSLRRAMSTERFLFRPSRALAARMRRTDSSMRFSEMRPDFTASSSPAIAASGDGRHQQHVRARFDGSHGGFSRRIVRGDAAHIQRVGDDQAAKFHFVAQQAGEDIVATAWREVRDRARTPAQRDGPA